MRVASAEVPQGEAVASSFKFLQGHRVYAQVDTGNATDILHGRDGSADYCTALVWAWHRHGVLTVDWRLDLAGWGLGIQ